MVGLNCWLLYGKYQMNRQVQTLKALNIHGNPQKSLADKYIQFTGLFDKINPLTLVAVFTDMGCNSCVIAEIKFLNEWSKKWPHTIQVYYEGSIKNYLEKYGADFSYQKVDYPERLFNTALVFGNPVVAVVDRNGIVQSLHTNDLSKPGSDQRRTNFYKRISSLFKLIKMP